jgi:hypothetical protein
MNASTRMVRAGMAPLALALLLAGCERNPLIVSRSACPAVAVAAHVGDVTLFRSAGTDAADIDAVATITNVREECSETADQFVTRVTFDVVTRRTDAAQARQISLPVFAAVVQAGNVINAKEITNVGVNFAAGQARGIGQATITAAVSRRAASVSSEIMARINRNRKPGDIDAATDPMADPEVRAAMRSASFEVLLGFQIDERALAYNVAK